MALSQKPISDAETLFSETRPKKKTVNNLLLWISRKLHYVLTSELTKDEALHPDFRMPSKWDENLTWYQNRDWGMGPNPPYKVGFFINDLSALDQCPYVCKFGNNLNPKFPDFQYFCVAYGDPDLWKQGYGLEKMKEWAQQFNHSSLMTYGGKLVQMLGAEKAIS